MYKNLPKGGDTVEVTGFEEADAALALIQSALDKFKPIESQWVNPIAVK